MKKTLFQKNRHLKTFFNSIPSAMYIVDHNLTVFDLNTVASNMIGRRSETKLRSRYGEVMQCLNDYSSVKGCGNTNFCDECVIRKMVNKARDENKMVSQDFVLKIIKDDQLEATDMKITAAPLEMEDSNYVILTLEKGRASLNTPENPGPYNLTLQESEARFKDIANNAQVWIWEVDEKGKYTYSSPVVKRILGYDQEEVLGKHFYDFFHPDEKQKLKELAFKAFEYKKSFRNFINRNIHKNGHTVVLSTSGVPVFDDNGTAVGYRGSDKDITDYYTAEKALQESEGHLRSLMDSAEGFAIYRLAYDRTSPHSLRVMYASPSLATILGIAEPMKFETWFERVHPDDLERIKKANQRAFETHHFNEEFRFYNPEKKAWRWIHAISTGFMSEADKSEYVNGILIDITDRQNAYVTLESYKKELESRADELVQMNTALNVLLSKREQDKSRLEDRITDNIEKLIFPYLERFRRRNLDSEQLDLLDIIESNLHEITAGFSSQLSSTNIGLTPTEIKIADLVRQGQKTKQIAHLLCLSPKTVESHRERIRMKLGIKNSKINLQSYLLGMK